MCKLALDQKFVREIQIEFIFALNYFCFCLEGKEIEYYMRNLFSIVGYNVKNNI